MSTSKLVVMMLTTSVFLGGLFVYSLIAAPTKVATASEFSEVVSVSAPASTSSAAAATAWEYGRLTIDGESVSWQGGESNAVLQTFSLETQYRRLGGGSTPTLTNLLNLLGNDGWELVIYDGIDWIFKRQK